jgi:hypothetical protein
MAPLDGLRDLDGMKTIEVEPNGSGEEGTALDIYLQCGTDVTRKAKSLKVTHSLLPSLSLSKSDRSRTNNNIAIY